MSEKENARSTAATVKRAEAAVFSGAAASRLYSTTPASVCQVAAHLPVGASNAISGKGLAAMLGYKSLRLLSRQIQRERLAGAPICAAVSGDSRGYYLASSQDELSAYLRALDRRLREVRRTRDACGDTLRRMTGQEVLRSW